MREYLLACNTNTDIRTGGGDFANFGNIGNDLSVNLNYNEMFNASSGAGVCSGPKHIYFLSIMDVLTHYGIKKAAAKAAKTMKYGSDVEGISTAEPDQYSKRFLSFINEAIE